MRAPWDVPHPLPAASRPGRLSSPLTAVVAGALLLALAACAGGGGAATATAPPPGGAGASPGAEAAGPAIAALLTPPEGAVRAAADVELTGRELGTMWTFENPPVDQWRERYGFSATAEWLEHVRLSSVRYGEICSASFVSPDGLVMTNHHCARDCIEAVSTAQSDYVVAGFYARDRTAELLCPELFLDQLVDIDDVTERVRAAAPAGAGSELVTRARQEEIEAIEQECRAAGGDACEVVTLFQGGQFQLYTYERYAPVKLVFAPELQAGFYGGDPDNFTYPRYALDVSFVRAYEPDGSTPASTPEHFTWDPEGAAEGELVFITGNPGSTSRLITVGQLLYERSYRHPLLVSLYDGQRRMLQAIAAQGPEMERAVRDDLFSIENSLKAFSGQLEGLRDTLLVATKLAWEREFRDRVSASPAARQYTDVWDRLAGIQAEKIAINPSLNFSNSGLLGAPHLFYASQLGGWLRASALPEGERPAQFQGGRFEQMRGALEEPSPVPEAFALPPLELQLELSRTWLPAGHPILAALMRPGESPGDAARRLLRESRVLDAGYRRALMAAGPAVLDTISDPLLRGTALMDSIYADALPRWEALVAEETVQKSRLAQALFEVYGAELPPDATFTLRISDGVVSRYPYNGTVAPPVTSLYGLYARAADFGNEMPWTLPANFEAARARVDMATPFNFVSTNDITGGNSGSPMIDRDARVVGIAFDGNVEQLPNEFLFRTEAGRTVAVHSAGILEALRNVYEAEALVEELLGGSR